jgi:hypothetical protein
MPLAVNCRSFKVLRRTGKFELRSVVRRLLVILRPGVFVRLGCTQPVEDGLESGFQGLNVRVLPKHHVAQFRGGALQEGDLGLNLLQSFIVHP